MKTVLQAHKHLYRLIHLKTEDQHLKAADLSMYANPRIPVHTGIGMRWSYIKNCAEWLKNQSKVIKCKKNVPHNVVMISKKKLKNHDNNEPDWLICKNFYVNSTNTKL